MNRKGLVIALALAVVVGIVFGVYPWLDLDLSGLFFDSSRHVFVLDARPWALYARDAARLLVTLLVAPAFLAFLGKIVWPNRPMLIGGPAAVFLALTLALGPGVLSNLLLKDHWGRPRPIDVTEFGGHARFRPWWDPRGECPNNCSFVAGEPSGAFWTLAPASLAPPQWRVAAYAGALTFGIALGVLRMGGGGHFFSDVAFAGILIFLLNWLLHGAMFRWAATRISDDAVERPLANIGRRIRSGVTALARRLGARPAKP